MNRSVLLLSTFLFAVLGLTGVAHAEDTLLDKFIGSPLLILAGLIVVIAVAFGYHKMRK